MTLKTAVLKVEIPYETYALLRKLQRQLKKEGLNHTIDQIANSLLRDFINLPKEKQEEVLKEAMRGR